MELRRKKVKEEEMGEGGRMTQKSYKLVGHFGHRYWSVPSLLEWRRERVARADLHLSVCLPYSLLFSFSPFLLPISCFPSFFPFPFLSFSVSLSQSFSLVSQMRFQICWNTFQLFDFLTLSAKALTHSFEARAFPCVQLRWFRDSLKLLRILWHACRQLKLTCCHFLCKYRQDQLDPDVIQRSSSPLQRHLRWNSLRKGGKNETKHRFITQNLDKLGLQCRKHPQNLY